MRVFNRKLAKRIADCSRRLSDIRSKSGAISAADAAAENKLQVSIDKDVRTLRENFFNADGSPMRFPYVCYNSACAALCGKAHV
jgi:hypothetical protein